MRIRFILCAALAVVSRALATEHLQEGPLCGLDISAYSPELREQFRKANEDCIDIENYRLPRHAEPLPMGMRDGGSRYFSGGKYSILLRKSLFPSAQTNDGLKGFGYSYGYELFAASVEELDKYPGMRPLLSKVWFVTNDRIREMEKDTHAELQKRIPPLEKYFRLEPVKPEDKEEANRPAQPPQADGPRG